MIFQHLGYETYTSFSQVLKNIEYIFTFFEEFWMMPIFLFNNWHVGH